jgi:hypothetical protein
MHHHRTISARNRLLTLAAPTLAGFALLPSSSRGQDATPLASPLATPVAGDDLPTEQVAMLTGPEPSLNNTWDQWEVYGTDLGSSFLYGDEMFLIFGDTFAANDADWRSNVIAVTTDDDPSNGITFDRMITDREGHAKEVLPSKKVDFEEMTVIPTYGIAVADRMFLHYMSVAHWGLPGHWDLGHSGWAYSDDGGESWTKDPDAQWPGDSNFGQVALEEHDGHIYIWGIPGGRYGGVQLARTAPEALIDIGGYEYWDGTAWSDDPADAAIVIPPNVGELSVRWNSYYNRWIMMYLNDPIGLIELRVAEEITGPWSEPYIAARATDYPSLYAPYMFPKWNDSADIYFNMSMFGPYQVFLMRTQIPELMP